MPKSQTPQPSRIRTAGRSVFNWLFVGKNPFRRWIHQLLVSIIVVLIGTVAYWTIVAKQPNIVTEMGQVSFSSETSVTETIKKVSDARTKNGISIIIDNEKITIPATFNGTRVFWYNTASIAHKIWESGRIRVIATRPPINEKHPFPVSIDEDALIAAVQNATKKFERTYTAPGLAVQNNTFTVTPEQIGTHVDLDDLEEKVSAALSGPMPGKVALTVTKENPQISEQDIQKFLETTPLPMDNFPFSITIGSTTGEIDARTWTTFVRIVKNDDGTLKFAFSDHGKEWLGAVAKSIAANPDAGSITIGDNGKVTAFTPAKRGSKINVDATGTAIVDAWLHAQRQVSPVVTDVVLPDPTPGTAAAYGIFERLGQGVSDFKKSPKNRIRNITNGVKAVNGVLVPPGDEFSLLKTIGEISEKTGYLPELVIKGNKTTPEYGGGLCQIGTTTFRGALNSGLPITERRNHSYAVSYYFPIGTDATIYDPAPDFKFKNDTAGHVLISTRIEGSKVIFDFWGTADGRKADYPTTPRTFNKVPAPPMKTTETPELKPGEKKCTESAHDGIDATFDYVVTYADGHQNKQTFFSRYKPWQAVCLVGAPVPTTTPAPTTPTTEGTPPSIDIPTTDTTTSAKTP